MERAAEPTARQEGRREWLKMERRGRGLNSSLCANLREPLVVCLHVTVDPRHAKCCSGLRMESFLQPNGFFYPECFHVEKEHYGKGLINAEAKMENTDSDDALAW